MSPEQGQVVQKIGDLYGKPGICVQTGFNPRFNPLAIVEIGRNKASLPDTGFMVTAAGADG